MFLRLPRLFFVAEPEEECVTTSLVPRSHRWLYCCALLAACAAVLGNETKAVPQQADSALSPPVYLTSAQEHQRLRALLQITALRRGPDGNPKSPNAANYDEAKAGPDGPLPDPLVLKNGKPVKTADEWWKKRRPEIVEDFDREILGRVPARTPKVNWEV